MLNQIIIQGRMTRDPEKRLTQSQKPVTTFCLAVERDYLGDGEKRDVDFIDTVAFNNLAEFASSHFKKGDAAVVVGRLQIREWTDKDGNKRRNAEVIADRIYFGGAKKTETKPEETTEEFPFM